jgi:hypothetical protein
MKELSVPINWHHPENWVLNPLYTRHNFLAPLRLSGLHNRSKLWGLSIKFMKCKILRWFLDVFILETWRKALEYSGLGVRA